jgi:hypothetical protein
MRFPKKKCPLGKLSLGEKHIREDTLLGNSFAWKTLPKDKSPEGKFPHQEIPSPLIELIFLPHGTQITFVEVILLPLEATFLGPYFKTMWV